MSHAITQAATLLLKELRTSGPLYPSASTLSELLDAGVPVSVKQELATLAKNFPHTADEKIRAAALCRALIDGEPPAHAAAMAEVAHIGGLCPA